MKRGPKGDPNPQKGPLGDLGPLKGTHCVTVTSPSAALHSGNSNPMTKNPIAPNTLRVPQYEGHTSSFLERIYVMILRVTVLCV